MRFAGPFLSLFLIAAAVPNGCDSTQPAEQSSHKLPTTEVQVSTPKTREMTKDELDKCFGETPGTLQRSAAHPVSGDLRPFWIITGRVQNVCDYDLGRVTVRVWVYRRGHPEEILDTADVVINDVPAKSVR